MRWNVGAVLLSVMFIGGALSQTVGDRERSLDVERAEVDRRQAEASYLQAKKLYDAGLLSSFELRRSSTELERAEIGYKKATAAFANELPAFRIRRARKRAGSSGELRVALEMEALEGAASDRAERTFLVSLKSGSTIVAEPYQIPISVRKAGDRISVEFVLLRDADDLTISVVSGTRHEDIQLVVPRESAGEALRLSAAAVALEGTAGDRIEYAIDVERFSARVSAVRLDTQALPDGFVAEWTDVEAKSHVSELRFGEKDRKQLALKIFLPAEVSGQPGEALIRFRAIAEDLQGRARSALELSCRIVGTPKLSLIAQNLLVAVEPEKAVTVPIVVSNDGTGPARDIRLDFSPPEGIDVRAEPEVIRMLPGRGHFESTLVLRPNAGAVHGEYVLKVRAVSRSRQAAVESTEVIYRIELGVGRLRWGAAVTAFVLIAATLGAFAWGARLRRGRRATTP